MLDFDADGSRREKSELALMQMGHGRASGRGREVHMSFAANCHRIEALVRS
mgnify:CR=1 FL=1